MSRFEHLSLPPAHPDPGWAARRAAVAVILGPDDTLLFIRRAVRAGDPWSGDMAFPGGGEEPDDPDLRATAARETREEVGLDLSEARFHGALPPLAPLRLPLKRFNIHPYLFSIDRWGAFEKSQEVAEIHHISLPRLMSGEGRGEFTWTGWGLSRVVPCVVLDGLKVWGLTLRVVDDLTERLRARS